MSVFGKQLSSVCITQINEVYIRIDIGTIANEQQQSSEQECHMYVNACVCLCLVKTIISKLRPAVIVSFIHFKCNNLFMDPCAMYMLECVCYATNTTATKHIRNDLVVQLIA